MAKSLILYPGYDALTEQELVAVTGYGEARDQGPEGILAVCSGIRNRRDLWHQSYRQVCLAENQFECFVRQAHVLAPIAKAWDSHLLADKALTRCYAIAHDVVVGAAPSNVGKSTFYKRFDCVSPWFEKQIAAGKLIEHCRINDHVFYLERRFV